MRWALQWLVGWLFALWAVREALLERRPPPLVREIAPDVYEMSAWPVAGSTRVVPAFRNGRAYGFKVFSVPLGTGLKGGDVVLRVNGLVLASPDNALEAWSKLKAASRFEIDLERDGRLLKKTYVLRPPREAPSSHPSTSPGDH